MTVQELRKILEDYPSAMNIKIALGHQIADLNCVNSGVDMDTNQKSVWLCHEEKEMKVPTSDVDTTDLFKFYQDFLNLWDDYAEKMRGLLDC